MAGKTPTLEDSVEPVSLCFPPFFSMIFPTLKPDRLFLKRQWKSKILLQQDCAFPCVNLAEIMQPPQLHFFENKKKNII